jgi:hypothetical protein
MVKINWNVGPEMKAALEGANSEERLAQIIELKAKERAKEQAKEPPPPPPLDDPPPDEEPDSSDQKVIRVQKAKSEALREMNETYFIFREGGKMWVGWFEVKDKRETLVSMDFGSFRNMLLNRKIKWFTKEQIKKIEDGDKTVEPKQKRLADFWLEHEKRTQYKGVVLEPGKPTVVDGYLNIWRGFGREPIKGDWSLMQRHIKEIVCAGNEARSEYFINWLAWAVQNPAIRAEVALVVQGIKGSGKGTVFNAMIELFGQHGLQISHASQLTGKFNGHMRNTMFLFADEAFWAGDKQGEGSLKRMLTEPDLAIEAKGRDLVSVRNMLHVGIASNEDWVVPATDGERRFFVMKCLPNKARDASWFDPIHKQMNNGGYEAMLYDLLHRDLTGFHPRRIPEEANDLLDQQVNSLDPFDAWWVSMLQSAALPGATDVKPERAKNEDGKDVAGEHFDGMYTSAKKASPRLGHWTKEQITKKLKEHGCKSWVTSGTRGWEFPPLADLRAKWMERFPTWKWDNEATRWGWEDATG